jgi:hypothetical protein
VIGPEEIDGAIVVALGFFTGAGELVGRRPEFAKLVLTTKPGRRYVGINMIAAFLAYAAALALKVSFRAPNDLWRVLTCGLTSMAVIRSALPGIGFPAQALDSLRAQYEKELNNKHQIRNAREAGEAVDGLDWDTDRDALGTICLVIAERHTTEGIDSMALRIAEIDETDLKPEGRIYLMAVWLQGQFGQDVLREAASKVRQINTPLPATVVS